MKNDNGKTKAALLVIMIALAVGILFSGGNITAKKGAQTAVAASENEYASIEMLNEVGEDFTFSVRSEGRITDENIGSYVRLQSAGIFL